MALIDDIKDLAGISGTDSDTEVNDLIDAAKKDLYSSGVSETVTYTDSLFKRAISLYVKANFGYDNKEADRFEESYDKLKSKLTIAGDYIAT